MMHFLALKIMHFLKDMGNFDQFDTGGEQCAPPGQPRKSQTPVRFGLICTVLMCYCFTMLLCYDIKVVLL